MKLELFAPTQLTMGHHLVGKIWGNTYEISGKMPGKICLVEVIYNFSIGHLRDERIGKFVNIT